MVRLKLICYPIKEPKGIEMQKTVIAIIGTYRKGGTIDSAIDAILKGADENGMQTKKIYLQDKHIEFCTNCRLCASSDLDAKRGKCVHNDDMTEILDQVDAADAIVLGSPINFFTVTAVTKRFVERLMVFAWWPWDTKGAPKYRISKPTKKAVLVTSSACPAFLGRILMPSALRILKAAARCMGAKVTKSLYFGMAAINQYQHLSEAQLRKAYNAGAKLAKAI